MKQITLLGLPKLTLALAHSICDIPNTEGFRLLGILKTNRLAQSVTVRKGVDGCHYLTDQLGSRVSPTFFSGWVADTFAPNNF